MDQWSVLLEKFGVLIEKESLGGQALNALVAVILALIVWIIIKTILRTAKKRLASIDLIRSNAKLFDMVRRAMGYGLLLVIGMYLIGLFHLQWLEKLFPAFFMPWLTIPRRPEQHGTSIMAIVTLLIPAILKTAANFSMYTSALSSFGQPTITVFPARMFL